MARSSFASTFGAERLGARFESHPFGEGSGDDWVEADCVDEGGDLGEVGRRGCRRLPTSVHRVDDGFASHGLGGDAAVLPEG
jgi:hypothetical protein